MVAIREYRREDGSACPGLFDSNLPQYFALAGHDFFAAFLQRMRQPFFVAESAHGRESA